MLCDWLPWNHTFGGNHNFGIVLYNGGTLYIDDGKPMPVAFDTTLAQPARDRRRRRISTCRAATTCSCRSSAGDRRAARAHFFSRLKMLFCAAAALRQQVADDIQSMAVDARRPADPARHRAGRHRERAVRAVRRRFRLQRRPDRRAGARRRAEAGAAWASNSRRGCADPNITPGYWRDAGLTARRSTKKASTGWAMRWRFVDPAGSVEGLHVRGAACRRTSSCRRGTWVSVGPLRQRLLAHFRRPGAGRRDCRATSATRSPRWRFRRFGACRALCGADVRSPFRTTNCSSATSSARRSASASPRSRKSTPGTRPRVARLILLEDPPSIDAQETTDKGSVNQKSVLTNRAALVAQLYGAGGPGIVISRATGAPAGAERGAGVPASDGNRRHLPLSSAMSFVASFLNHNDLRQNNC